MTTPHMCVGLPRLGRLETRTGQTASGRTCARTDMSLSLLDAAHVDALPDDPRSPEELEVPDDVDDLPVG